MQTQTLHLLGPNHARWQLFLEQQSFAWGDPQRLHRRIDLLRRHRRDLGMSEAWEQAGCQN
jgi:hypothetical protein